MWFDEGEMELGRQDSQRACTVVIASNAPEQATNTNLGRYMKRTDILIHSNKGSLPPITLLASDSFISHCSHLQQYRSSESTLLIPVLLPDSRLTKKELYRELEAAREASGSWPVAVIDPKGPHDEFARSLHAHVQKASDLVQSIRQHHCLIDEGRALVSNALKTLAYDVPLARMLAAMVGKSAHQEQRAECRLLKDDWNCLVYAWNAILDLCGQPVKDASGSDLRFEWHWWEGDLGESLDKFRKVLKKLRGSSKEYWRSTTEAMELVLKEHLPVRLAIASTAAFPDASAAEGKSALHLRIERVDPLALAAGTASEEARGIDALLLPDLSLQFLCKTKQNEPSNGSIKTEPRVRMVRTTRSPAKGKVIWIGPSAVSILDAEKSEVCCCLGGTSAEPLSHLAPGDPVVKGQRLLAGPERTNDEAGVHVDGASEKQQQENFQQSCEAAAAERALLLLAEERFEGACFAGDLVSAPPYHNRSSEAVTLALHDEAGRTGWRSIPFSGSRAAGFYRGYSGVKAFRDQMYDSSKHLLLGAGWKLMLSAFREADQAMDAIRSGHHDWRRRVSRMSDEINASNKALSSFCEAMVSSLREEATDSEATRKRIADQLAALKSVLIKARECRNPEPSTYPQVYKFVETQLVKLDDLLDPLISKAQKRADGLREQAKVIGIKAEEVFVPDKKHFTSTYWEKGFLLFPNQCKDYNEPGASGRSVRGNWLQETTGQMYKQISDETEDFQSYPALAKSLKAYANAIMTLVNHLLQNLKETKKECDSARSQLDEAEKKYAEEAVRMQQVMSLLADLCDSEASR